MTSTLIVIPARWGSTRLPGKPLSIINGKTLLQRVADNAAAAARQRPGTDVIIATDDQRIADHGLALGHTVAMTDHDLDSGTERVFAAVRLRADRPDYVVNLQGDNPFTAPATLLALVDALAAGAQVATPVVTLDWDTLDRLRAHKAISPFSGTTCICDRHDRAMWFSKNILPAIRDEAVERATSSMSPVLRHLGVYGYTLEALRSFCAAEASRTEQLEGLEQLRFLELQIPIKIVRVEEPALSLSGIDTPADLDRARESISTFDEPVWS